MPPSHSAKKASRPAAAPSTPAPAATPAASAPSPAPAPAPAPAAVPSAETVVPQIMNNKSASAIAANALFTRMSQWKVPGRAISRLKGELQSRLLSGAPFATSDDNEIEVPLFEEETFRFTSAQAAEWTREAKKLHFQLKFITLKQGTLTGDGIKTDYAKARAERKGPDSEAQMMDDPNGGFAQVSYQKGEAKFEDPEEMMAAKVTAGAAWAGVDEAAAHTGATCLEKLFNGVLSNYSCNKRDPNPFVKSAVNILLTSLSGAHGLITTANKAFADQDKGYLAPLLTEEYCNSATLVLQTPVTGTVRGKEQISAFKLKAFAARLGIDSRVYVDESTKCLTATVTSAAESKAQLVKAINLTLYLAGFADHSEAGRSATSTQKFMNHTYTAVGAARDRTWSDYLITRRIGRNALSDVKVKSSRSIREVIASWVEPTDDDEEKLPKGYIEPALYGFRCYLANLKGRKAKTAAKLTAAMGATIEVDGSQVRRHDLAIEKLSMIPDKNLDEYTTFITRATPESFREVLKALG